MTRESFKTFAEIIRETYPKETILNTSSAMEIWYEFLSDIPDEVAMAVLKNWISDNKWSPAISDIREGAVKIVHGEVPDWGRAWETVLKAIRKYGRYQEADALASLDELTRECVENIGFKYICNAEEEDIGYMKKDFEKLYTLKAERKRRALQVPMIGRTEQDRLTGQTAPW